jgi:predicted nucleic acid-binding protein
VRRLHLDTNVIARALFPGEGRQFERSRAFLSGAESGGVRILVTAVILAEVLYVVEDHLAVDRRSAARALGDFLSHRAVHCQERLILQDALVRYSATNMDFPDCYLAALAAEEGIPVCSFDRDHRKFPDVERFEP